MVAMGGTQVVAPGELQAMMRAGGKIQTNREPTGKIRAMTIDRTAHVCLAIVAGPGLSVNSGRRQNRLFLLDERGNDRNPTQNKAKGQGGYGGYGQDAFAGRGPHGQRNHDAGYQDYYVPHRAHHGK